MIALYANLVACLNGDLLHEQCGITIEDHVRRRCRITVANALPERGPEIDARRRLGETVKLSVHILPRDRSLPGPALIEIEGPIVSARIAQEPGGEATLSFTVEQERLAPED